MLNIDEITGGEDTLSIEDIQRRISYLELAEHLDPNAHWDEALTEGEEAELTGLRNLREDLEHREDAGTDDDALVLIHEDHFPGFAQAEAEDGCKPGKLSSGLQDCIDWDQWAEQMKEGFSSVELMGSTYYYR